MQVYEKIVRISQLPFVLEESLKYMNEGDGIILSCNLDNDNAIYLGGSDSIFDVNRYITTGKIIITIKLHRFVNGRSVIKSVKKYTTEIFNTAKSLITNNNHEEAQNLFINIIEYIDNLQDKALDDVFYK